MRENPNVFSGMAFITHWREFFGEATHLERLALVRNPDVYSKLIEHIFDLDDTFLGIGIAERKELALAYLSNSESVDKSHRTWRDFHPDDGFGAWSNETPSQLWLLASKWPPETRVPGGVYRYVKTTDETKAKVYQGCADPIFREVILESCDGSETETIRAGTKDAESNCRRMAHSKVDVRADGGGLQAIHGRPTPRAGQGCS